MALLFCLSAGTASSPQLTWIRGFQTSYNSAPFPYSHNLLPCIIYLTYLFIVWSYISLPVKLDEYNFYSSENVMLCKGITELYIILLLRGFWKVFRNTNILATFWHTYLTSWLMKPEGSMPHSQGLSNNPYLEPNQPNSSYWYLMWVVRPVIASNGSLTFKWRR